MIWFLPKMRSPGRVYQAPARHRAAKSRYKPLLPRAAGPNPIRDESIHQSTSARCRGDSASRARHFQASIPAERSPWSDSPLVQTPSKTHVELHTECFVTCLPHHHNQSQAFSVGSCIMPRCSTRLRRLQPASRPINVVRPRSSQALSPPSRKCCLFMLLTTL